MKLNEEKNDYFFQDINFNEKSITFKMFHFFYSVFQSSKEYSLFLKCLYILLEAFQLISYAFTSNHYDSWNLGPKNIRIISNIVSVFRFSPIMKFLDYKIYSIILYLLIICIFLLFLTVVLQILFGDKSSKFYRFSIGYIHIMLDIFVSSFYIPTIEVILLPIRCVNGKVYGVRNAETCWEYMHYLNVTLGIIAAFLFFIMCIILINFNFYPFQKNMSTNRVNSNNDVIIIIMKSFLVLQYLLIKNEYLSLTILLLASISMFFSCFNEPTYNNDKLEIIITIKNLVVVWTYFILLVTKLFKNVVSNGFIYLLIFGCPIIVIFSIVLYKEKDLNFSYFSGNSLNIADYIKKVKFSIKLIDSYIERNNNIRNRREDEVQRDIILLKGNIKIHNNTCANKDCPLTKFMNNEGNFNIQKQCLLNYMNLVFNEGLKKYPNNINLLILFIHFNYNKKFNLNSVRTNMLKLKKAEYTLKQKFIIYCIEQNLRNMKNNNGFELDIEYDQDNDSQIDITEQKYLKLKYLIENSIKLYGEFWGIFSTNVTNNINTYKLYSLGEKLNRYLNEINNLWDNELKNKKINNEYKSIVQLYSKFLLEILWDQKKSKEVSRKLNDESNNYLHQSENKKENEENNNGANLQNLLNNQDFLLFCDSNEKGNCKISNCSESFSHFLNYQKYDIIGKPLDIIFPNILIENLSNHLEESIKSLHNGKNNQKDLSYQENDSTKNEKLIMIKSRMGYIFPLYSSFIISDDNNFSDSFLVKAKLENKEPKSEYGYFVLTNLEFNIENISSSAINLELSLDLLKKYVVKMDILVRSEENRALDLKECYNEFEEEPRKVTWIFPDIIYPKDNFRHNNDEEIEDLIEKSDKKKYNLIIKPIRFDENENIGYVFKFTEIVLKKRKKNLNLSEVTPKSEKKLIMFDLLTLNYIRTMIVEKKSDLRSLRKDEVLEKEEFRDSIQNSRIKKEHKIKRNKNNSILEEEESSYDSDKNESKNILTNEKVIELQAHNYVEIRNFIYSLPIYASEVILERFRPNGEKYSASKISESLIKIKLNKFCKMLEDKYHFEQNMRKKKVKIPNMNNNQIESPKSSNTNNVLNPTYESSPESTNISSPGTQGEELNKGLTSDTSSTLSNVFKADSIKYIRILVFFTFIETLLLLALEFVIMYHGLNKLKMKIDYVGKGFVILKDIVYIKYFVTEGVLGNSLNDTYFPSKILGLENFLNYLKGELAFYRQEFTETYDEFSSNDLSKEFKDFIEDTKLELMTLTVNIPENYIIIFNSAMTRIPSSVNNLVSEPTIIHMGNRDTYELMHNLINEYYINWQKATDILLNDSIKATGIKTPLMIIVLCSFLASIIILFIFLKLLSIFSLDREKPINLFLTMKKKVFENLKNSAENFSNKLLNKLFGNDEGEEESQQDYQSNIHPNDINIVKFKAANDNHSSIKNAFSFMEIVIVLSLFLFIYLICFITKYMNFRNRMENIYQYISLFNKTNIEQISTVLSFDIFKSYLFNRSIPILNNNNTLEEFINVFNTISNKFQHLILYTSKTDSFLKGEYLNKFKIYLSGNITELLDPNFIKINFSMIKNTIQKGLKISNLRLFENIRYMIITYCISDEIDNPTSNISYINKESGFRLFEVNSAISNIIRYWYNGVLKLMVNTFNDYQSKSTMYFIIFFICLIVICIIFYTIIWRIYEEKLIVLLKESVDLINLIPQEIKNVIIEKLNE